MAYAGFDRADCPDLAVMRRLKAQTNLVWCGYYLRAPSQAATTWGGKRSALVSQGWGLAPIYVGQQTIGPGSHLVNPAQGKIDGGHACAELKDEGFPAGACVYLDLENGPPFTAAQQAYVGAWIAAVEAGGHKPGVYCSYLPAFADEVAKLWPQARLWVYHVRTCQPHAVAGSTFAAPDPAASGHPGATLWQHDDEARLTLFGDLAVDLDSSHLADPSATDGNIAVSQPTPQPAVGSIAWVQESLNALGAPLPRLVVDGEIGKATEAAVAAFQSRARLYVDGIPGSRTTAALLAALAHKAT